MKVIELFTIVQLVMGAAMGIGGIALLLGVFALNAVPVQAMLAVCLIAIAGKYIIDGLIQMMSAMSTNVKDEIVVPENIKELVH